MTELPKPEVILTHESDLDGLISGVLLQRLALQMHGVEVRLEAFHYNQWKQRDVREAAAWVCDLSFEKRLDQRNWVVIDHHKTDHVPKHAILIHDLNKSAGLLCYELCRERGLDSPKLDRLLHLNNVSDLFLEDDPDFILANDYANLVKVYQFWNLHALIKGQLEQLVDHPLLRVMNVKREVEDPLGLAWARENVIPLGPDVGYVNTVIGNTNMVIHEMLEKRLTPYPVLVTLFRRGNGAMIVSLRSRDGSALKVAEKLQGGGHANACGASLPRSVKSISDAITYLRQILDPASRENRLNSLENLFDEIALDQSSTDGGFQR